jgi:L-lactate permease
VATHSTTGATLGNMICINNIISAKAVMNMTDESEGRFIKKTAPVAFLMYVIVTAVALPFLLIKTYTEGVAQPGQDPTGGDGTGIGRRLLSLLLA